ncbi:neutral zinc metallopeptidase (plasmid) [Mycolicibacterium psychrotolerans]|uniref:neutral zinc metallopeptidase n=1 Tax=Mycolicibacterium psychrotolerans TaxID=216929 RepID=UPI003D67FBDD
MASTRRHLHGRWVTALAAVIVAVGGCASPVHGRVVAPLDDPFGVAGLPVTDGPSGLRADAPAPTTDARGSKGDPVDILAEQSLDDVQDFWQQHYAPVFGGSFRPVAGAVSYDANNPLGPAVCGISSYDLVNAMYCRPDRQIYWDRGVFVPTARRYFGDDGVVGVLAHEFGHAIQGMGSFVTRDAPVLVIEQQADCLAGVYLRWVAEGNSPRFTLSTGDGLNTLLAGVITIRDPVLTKFDDPEEGHGTALDRVAALQTGFTSGPSACVAIDMDQIRQRRAGLPIALQTGSRRDLRTVDRPVDHGTVTDLIDQLNTFFSPSSRPALSFDPTACPEAQATTPVSYCPQTNTVAVDLPAVQRLGAPADEAHDLTLVQGPNTAWSVVTSRYVLALQHARNLPLDRAITGLRTACLTGAAQRHMARPDASPGAADGVGLIAGDVDQAIAGLLTNGLVASDVNGATVPAGFTRIAAYRAGLTLDDPDQCYGHFQ